MQKTHHTATHVLGVRTHSLEERRGVVWGFGGRGVVLVRNPYKEWIGYYLQNKKDLTRSNNLILQKLFLLFKYKY